MCASVSNWDYAENQSAGGGLFHKMSLGGDQWRMTAAAFTADLRYDCFSSSFSDRLRDRQLVTAAGA
jgi:hypothetical protein